MPVPITTTRWVRAIEMRPGTARVFHHANVIIDRSRSSRRQERVPGRGFPGMDLNVEEETFDPDGHFLSWKPGSEPVVEPDGMAWRADPGMDLMLNVHLRPTGKPETVSPMIGLYFTGQPQNEVPDAGAAGARLSASTFRPGDKDFLVTRRLKLPLDVNVLAVYPHAHYLGKLMEGYATLPDGTRKWLIRIPDWDLNWQGVYRLKEPLLLPKGTVVSMRYHYDNSADNVRNPNSPPREVKGGNQATDEMGHLWLQVLPVGGGDQRAALQEGLMRQRLEKYPDDFNANYNLGDALMNQGNAAGAMPYFEAASKANPISVVAATELGVALFAAGKLPEAEEQFKRRSRSTGTTPTRATISPACRPRNRSGTTRRSSSSACSRNVRTTPRPGIIWARRCTCGATNCQGEQFRAGPAAISRGASNPAARRRTAHQDGAHAGPARAAFRRRRGSWRRP